ncbi:hypothetical protein FRC03_006625 [Tulasnella sp. 419]|nr:hypothetical protein FRC03_006625 [Tulasnella sp. 419]
MDSKSRQQTGQSSNERRPESNYTASSQGTGPSSPSIDSTAAATAAAIAEDARARNARAQARHRAKRKAYIAHLETSLTTLQEALRRNNGDTRLQQLQQENARLHQEIESLRSQIEAAGISDDGSEASSLYGDIPAYSSMTSTHSSPYIRPGQQWQGRPISPHGYRPSSLGRSSHVRDSSYVEGRGDIARAEDDDVDTRDAGLMGWSPSQDKKPLPPTS